jgi:hypothetical protein
MQASADAVPLAERTTDKPTQVPHAGEGTGVDKRKQCNSS